MTKDKRTNESSLYGKPLSKYTKAELIGHLVDSVLLNERQAEDITSLKIREVSLMAENARLKNMSLWSKLFG